MVASTWITPGCVQFLKNKKRFHTAWVNCVVLTMDQLLLVYPEQRTLSDRSGMSQKCQHAIS
jgi:hypothetical protein